MKDIAEVIKAKITQRDQLAADITVLQRALILLQDDISPTAAEMQQSTSLSNPHGRWP